MTLSASNINWTRYIWPIVEGCTNISPGCLNCWAEEFVGSRLAPAEETRAAAKPVPERFRGLTVLRDGRHVFNGTVRFQTQLLDAPLRHGKPGRVFVAPRSDLFHEAVTDEQIAAVFGVMAASQHLTFQVLTKRAERAARWFAHVSAGGNSVGQCVGTGVGMGILPQSVVRVPWPLPNVHIGVTVEDQRHADARIPHLLAIPAAVRWLSVEPMLGPIDLGPMHVDSRCPACGGMGTGYTRGALCESCFRRSGMWPVEPFNAGIHWVVCGGESGHRARPFALEWADDVRRQCAAAGVAFWMKQAGSNAYLENVNYWPSTWARRQRPAPNGVTAAGAVGLRLRHPHGEDLDELPEALRVREWPRVGG